jgi:hypothetical protein
MSETQGAKRQQNDVTAEKTAQKHAAAGLGIGQVPEYFFIWVQHVLFTSPFFIYFFN